MPIEVQMHEQDPHVRQLIGLPPSTPKVKNPFYDATELEKAGKHKEAGDIYKQLLNEDFDNSVVLAALGMNLAVQGENGMAHVMLSRALDKAEQIVTDFKKVGIIQKDSADPKILADFLKTKKAEIMNALGTCWKHENKCDKARYWFERAQSIVPPNADIQNNLATLYINEGSPERAMSHLEHAIQLMPGHSQAHWNRSLCYLEMGEYEKGFKEYKWGKRAEVRMDRVYTNKGKLPEWDGSPGKTVVVYGEQGIGDEIMFASCLPDMMKDCKQVIFDCHKKLHVLFCNSFPALDIYPTREDEKITWPYKQDGTPRYQIDAKIAMGDVPQFYRNRLEDFPGTPYIQPTTANEQRWADRLAALPAKPKIGIAWIGGHKKTRVEVRSLKLEQLLPILSLDANFISLQYTKCEDEIQAFEMAHPDIKIHHWPEANYSENYDDQAGLVANLDLVICCCTSLVHLAGSMGVPTWVLTPSRPAWRYRLDLDYMPWYGRTVTLFRQQPNTIEWEPVVAEVLENLKDLLGATNA